MISSENGSFANCCETRGWRGPRRREALRKSPGSLVALRYPMVLIVHRGGRCGQTSGHPPRCLRNRKLRDAGEAPLSLLLHYTLGL
uniref:Uncharacterized protein n=1 Tax=Castor canadensis TaxID=51338 RepID=A0A8C0XQK7_CASCN